MSSPTTCTAGSVMSSAPCAARTVRVVARATRELTGPALSVKLYASVSGEGGAAGASSDSVKTGQADAGTSADMGNSLDLEAT